MHDQHPFTPAYPPIPFRPSADSMEAFAPEVFELGDRLMNVTLRGDTDFDSELFFAVEAILENKDLGTVLACITPTHPGTLEAKTLLRAAWLRHRAAQAATGIEA